LNPTTAPVTIAGNVTAPMAATSSNVTNVLALDGTAPGNLISGVISDPTGAAILAPLRLTKSNTSTWTLTNAANTYTGTTTVSGGTLQISTLNNGGPGNNSSIGASTNAAANLVLNGGTLRYTGGVVSTDRLFSLQVSSSLDSSGTGAVNFTNSGSMGFNGGTAAKTLTLTGTNTGNNTLAAAVGNNTGATSIAKTGIGTWVLSGDNSAATGTSSISGGGTLVLDYTAATSKLSSGALNLNGGTITLKGGSYTQVAASTALGAGGTFITRDTGTSKLQMNAITRVQGGSISFLDGTVATTDNTNTNGILGGWATIGDNWAINSTNLADGAITALGSYTGALPSGTGANTANYTLSGSQSGQSSTVLANTVKITGTGLTDNTLDLAGTRITITGGTNNSTSGGILYIGGGTGIYNITSTSGGGIGVGTNNRDLIINTVRDTLNVSARIGAVQASAGLVKTGAGTLVLSSPDNAFTQAVYVNQGTLLANNTTGNGTGTGAVTVNNGAALGGTGTVGGSTTIAAGGGLTFDLTTASGSHDKLELAATKTLTFSGGSTLTITSSGGTPGTGIFTLLTAPGGITGDAPATVNLPSGWTADAPEIAGNDLVINITSTGSGGSPEIAVEQNAIDIPNTTGSKDFGTKTIGTNTDLVFTILNTGNADLNLPGTPLVAISGHPDFTVHAQPADNPVLEGDSTTFTVRFNPQASGTRSATVSIDNDDADEDPFTFTVEGFGQTPYEAWAASFTPNPGGTGLNPDGDAFTNLLEFGFAFDPNVSDGSGPLTIDNPGPSGTITQNGPPQIYVDPVTFQYFLRYTRRTDHATAGITYTAQFAADSLGDGDFENVSGGTVVGTGIGVGGVNIEAVAIEFPDALPVSGKKARFGRVGVSMP